MFTVLDTNHFSVLSGTGPLSEHLQKRAARAEADMFTTIITAQEVMQGWLAALNRQPAGDSQLTIYARFHQSLHDLGGITILPFGADESAVFHDLLRQRIRIGSMDLKIAAICLAHEALLVSRNLVDFQKVPGLRVENWLD